MKKLMYSALAMGVLAVSLNSCKKDYTCTCTTSSGSSSTSSTSKIHDTRIKADKTCSDGNKTNVVAGVTFTTTCTIN